MWQIQRNLTTRPQTHHQNESSLCLVKMVALSVEEIGFDTTLERSPLLRSGFNVKLGEKEVNLSNPIAIFSASTTNRLSR